MILSTLRARVSQVHDFFHSPAIDEKKAKLEKASAKLLAGVAAFDVACTAAQRARLAYIEGRAHDACEGYSPEAEAALSRAVKLAPSDHEAFNALGHCFWKKVSEGTAKEESNVISSENERLKE